MFSFKRQKRDEVAFTAGDLGSIGLTSSGGSIASIVTPGTLGGVRAGVNRGSRGNMGGEVIFSHPGDAGYEAGGVSRDWTVHQQGEREKIVGISSEPHAICAKHGEFPRQFLTIALPQPQQYAFCPYCYGEWMASQFPVTEVKDATHEPL